MIRREFITTTLGAGAGLAGMSLPMTLVEPPVPYSPVPSPRQLAWHELEFYGFLHFTVNTFTNREWGDGDESPALFNPTDFDADQIVAAAKDGGMKGLILTCKHHDGFCLWPSRYTEHSVKNSPFKRDVVKGISEACARAGLKFGIYLSPWDRNHKDYGTPEYLVYYRNQLRELLTDYGPVFEIFFDGANGGDGYYGGAYERREIDNRTYYDWPNTWQIVRDLQPNTVLFRKTLRPATRTQHGSIAATVRARTGCPPSAMCRSGPAGSTTSTRTAKSRRRSSWSSCITRRLGAARHSCSTSLPIAAAGFTKTTYDHCVSSGDLLTALSGPISRPARVPVRTLGAGATGGLLLPMCSMVVGTHTGRRMMT